MDESSLCLLSLLLQNCDHHPLPTTLSGQTFSQGAGLSVGASRFCRCPISSSLWHQRTRGVCSWGIDHGVHGPGRAWLSHLGILCTALGTAPFCGRRKRDTTFFGDKSWPREEAALPVPQALSSPPCPCGAHCPLSCGLTGHSTPGFLSEPRLVSRWQWRPQVPQDNWAQRSFYTSGPGKSLPSHPANIFPGIVTPGGAGGLPGCGRSRALLTQTPVEPTSSLQPSGKRPHGKAGGAKTQLCTWTTRVLAPRATWGRPLPSAWLTASWNASSTWPVEAVGRC